MKTSPNGAPILSGSGLQSVRDRIQNKFDEARQAGATSVVPSKPHRSMLSAEPAVAKTPRTLHEIAVPILRIAEKKFTAPVRHPRHQEIYVVVEPKESLDILFSQSLEAIKHVPQDKKQLRFQVEETP